VLKDDKVFSISYRSRSFLGVLEISSGDSVLRTTGSSLLLDFVVISTGFISGTFWFDFLLLEAVFGFFLGSF
jgi:hypothetical protein